MRLKTTRIWLLGLLCAFAAGAYGQTKYKLKQVTTVEDGGMYVFEQGGYVMRAHIDSYELYTTNSYSIEGLSGTEDYVWKLDLRSGHFRIISASLDVDQTVVCLSMNNKNLCFRDRSNATTWDFNFTGQTAYISSGERYLGTTGVGPASHYKTYALSDIVNNTHPHDITVYKLVAAEAVTVSAAGLATYASDNGLDYSAVEGLRAYRAEVSGNSVAFHQVGQVPSGEGVLLRATTTLDEAKTYYVPTVDIASWTERNDFVRGTGSAVASTADGYYNYILNKVDGITGFYRAAGKTVAANRAYLRTTTPPAASSRMSMTFGDDDETMGIDELWPARQSARPDVFDLQGRRVSNPARGLYIINGKKTIIR